jgi:mannose-6-phosphate isomerase class I
VTHVVPRKAQLSRVRPTRVYRFYRGGALIDPVERLPVHAHPGREFARTHLGSEFGKTEAWIVVAMRAAAAEVWLGLSEDVEPARYKAWVEQQDTGALLGSLHHLTVRAGDVVFVPAGVPDTSEPVLGLPEAARQFFAVDDVPEPAGRFGVLLVLEGEGEIDGQGVRPGDAFALAAAAEPFDVRGDLRVLRCMGGI